MTDREHVVFVQYSDQLLTPDATMRNYYTQAFARMPGYVLPPDYYEIPYWIPLISGRLPDQYYRKELLVARDEAGLLAHASRNPAATYMFSVLEANLQLVKSFTRRTNVRTVLGGYTDPGDFSGMPHVAYLLDLDGLGAAFSRSLGAAQPDYSLFRGERVIPRYSLSSGCSFRCKFCTVPTQLVLTPASDVREQARRLEPLDFELVFLDDKSFGEAANWRDIQAVREEIDLFNPEFRGFIAQTPPSLACRDGFLPTAVELGLRYLEIGLEIYDDSQLKLLRKPFRTKHADRAVELARDLGIKIIPNLIMGLPGARYDATAEWIEKRLDVIPVVNVNWLAVHHGNERGSLDLSYETAEDGDQNADAKNWLSPEDVRSNWEAVHRIYAATTAAARTGVRRGP